MALVEAHQREKKMRKYLHLHTLRRKLAAAAVLLIMGGAGASIGGPRAIGNWGVGIMHPSNWTVGSWSVGTWTVG
jgi:hypothetical protein